MEAWIVAGAIAAGAGYCWQRWRQLARAEFVRAFGGSCTTRLL